MVWYVQRLVNQNVAEAKDLVLLLLRQIPGTASPPPPLHRQPCLLRFAPAPAPRLTGGLLV